LWSGPRHDDLPQLADGCLQHLNVGLGPAEASVYLAGGEVFHGNASFDFLTLIMNPPDLRCIGKFA
jgi:hypothetical protein